MTHSTPFLQRSLVATTLVLALGVATTATAAAVPRPGPSVERGVGTHRAAPTGVRTGEVGRLASRRSGVHLFDCGAVGPGGQCGTLRVPLDRAHPRRATLTLFFLYYRHRRPGPTREAIMVSEGGPGYSVTNTEFEKQNYKDVLDPLLGSRDLILLDQRGVGHSDAVTCRALQRNPDFGLTSILSRFATCAKQLGGHATMYGSGDVALDMEAVRKALGVRKLDLYGGSYAAQDVQSYTLRFPHRVRTAVLDSPFSASVYDLPGQTMDDYLTDVALELPDVADRLCARSRSCSFDRTNAHDDLAWLVQRLRTTPLTGTAPDLQGRPRTVTVTEKTLAWNILLAEDFNLIALSESAAAAASLRAGDPAPLLRLAAEAATPDDSGPDPVRNFSWGENAARSCLDLEFPWDTSAAVGVRQAQWQAAANALPATQFGLFSKQAWLTRPGAPLAPDPCIVWPGPKGSTPAAVPRHSSFPKKVPALVIAGDLDLSIPADDAVALHELWPGSDYVEIRNAQHHVWFTAAECADPVIVHFIEKRRTGDTSCAEKNTDIYSYPAVGRFPALAAAAVPATAVTGDGSSSADRQVVTVATSAVTDAFRRGFGPRQVEKGAGLRGGAFTIGFGDNHAKVKLTGARFAGDVAVTGKATYGYQSQAIDATVTVDGPGAEDGTLHIVGVWFGFRVPTTVLEVSGTIGGRAVAATVPAS
jgi:pimeloyl-ACP methyl ester carboxylesterase